MEASDSSAAILIGILIGLVLISAYFSSSETSMMSINRYRMKHLARKKHAGAMRVSRLLAAPDKLLGVILIGNNFVNLLAASIATTLSIQLFGNPETVLTTIVLTVVILIFAEITPKTIAALYPERIAYPSSLLLGALLKLLYPLVWMANRISNRLIRMLGFKPGHGDSHQLNAEELRTVVYESRQILPELGQGMLLNILDLDKYTVNDILVPRSEIIGIDLDDETDEILTLISTSQHTRLPIYERDIDSIRGVLHTRNLGRLLQLDTITKQDLLREAEEPYFIPESTGLHKQLFSFQSHRKRLAFVVNEYGLIRGIVTLEDILEEIVGEFTTDMATSSRYIHPQDDGTFVIDGTATLRDINRTLGWSLDGGSARTLNGMLMEILESIPDSPVGLDLGAYRAEIIHTKGNIIKAVRMWRDTSDQQDNGDRDDG